MKKVLFLTIIICYFILSCKKINVTEDNYDQTNITIGWYDSILNPSIQNCVTYASALEASLKEGNIEESELKWQSVSIAWRGVEPFIIKDFRNSFLAFRVDTWPVDTSDINELLNSTKLIDEDFVNRLPSDNVGIYAIEYLVFSKYLEKNENYYQLLKMLGAMLRTDFLKAEALIEDSEVKFKTSTGYTLSSTIGQVLNQAPQICEETLLYKIAIPIGYYEYIDLDDKQLEAWRSETSHTIIFHTLKNLKDVFYGVGDSEGLNDFLMSADKKDIVDTADEYFAEAEDLYNKLTTPLFGRLEDNKDVLTELRLSFKKIRSLLMISVAPTLGFTVTFSDSDGD